MIHCIRPRNESVSFGTQIHSMEMKILIQTSMIVMLLSNKKSLNIKLKDSE